MVTSKHDSNLSLYFMTSLNVRMNLNQQLNTQSILRPVLYMVHASSIIQLAWTVLKTELCKTGPEVIKLFSCSPQLSMKFFLLINVKMPTIVGILTYLSRKSSILSLSEPEKKTEFLDIFILMSN